MDLVEAITTALPRWEWGKVWLELHEHTGRVTPGFVALVARRRKVDYLRSAAFRRWDQGVRELDWVADRDVIHLFEERDDLEAWSKHLTPDQWDKFRRRL